MKSNLKIPPHYSQTLLDESRISEQIIHESNLWIAKKMLGNAAERRIVVKLLNPVSKYDKKYQAKYYINNKSNIKIQRLINAQENY